MAYLHEKGGCWYLACKTIDTLTLEERVSLVKFYGTTKPSKDQVDKDKKALGGPSIPAAIKKNKRIAFDIKARISKKNLESVIGTSWRNKYVHCLAEVERTELKQNGGYDLIEKNDEEDRDIFKSITWVNLGRSWKKEMEHWYRVDHLLPEEQLEGYRKRLGYCNEEVRKTRKEYNEKKRQPQEQDGCYAGNLTMRKHSWQWAIIDRDQAIAALEYFFDLMTKGEA